MKSHKSLIQLLALFLQHTHLHFHASILQLLYPTSLHLGERILTSYHATLELLTYQQVSTWRRFAIMAAWFETNIDSAILQQMLIFPPHRTARVDLCMPFSTSHMIPLTYNLIIIYYHSTNHRIGLSIYHSIAS